MVARGVGMTIVTFWEFSIVLAILFIVIFLFRIPLKFSSFKQEV
jgi:hypothetical protein